MGKKKEKKESINYFNMFIDGATVCREAAVALRNLMSDYTNVEEKSEAIHEIEHRGDDIYHDLYANLNHEFITPIERDDILTIAQYIDDTTDAIEDVASRFYMLAIDKIRPEAVVLADKLVKATEKLLEATVEFKHFKKSKTLRTLIIELNTIEEEGDRIYRKAVRDLYTTEKNVLEIVKWKEVFEVMETVLDTCENVANIMEGVVLNNS